MEHPVFGVDIKDRKYILQNYQKCFLGNEAVDWFVNSGGVFSRAEAVKLGQKMMDLQIIQHVAKQQPFCDKNYFYEFVSATVQTLQSFVAPAEKFTRQIFDIEQKLSEAYETLSKTKIEQDLLIKKLKSKQ